MTVHQEDIEHLQEDQLVQLLDREVEPRFLSAWDEHVSGCHPCAERLRELEHASSWVHEHVWSLNAGVPIDELARARALAAARQKLRPNASVWRTGLARAAAVAGIVVIGGLTVEPLRAWVLESAGRLADRFETSTPVVAVEEVAAGAMVSFQPAGELFVLELDHPQSTGSVTILIGGSEEASAQVLNGGDESLSVMPSALLIGNTASSQASYSIALPSAVERVQVIAGGETLLDRQVTGTAEPIAVSLAAGESVD